MTHVWHHLTIPKVLTAVEEVLQIPLTNLCIPRNSYINRVYECENAQTKDRYVVKFYRPGRWSYDILLQEHQLLHALAQHDIAVIEPLQVNDSTLFPCEEGYFTIFPKKGGRAVDEFDEDMWQQVGRLLGRIHLVSQSITHYQRLVFRPQQAISYYVKSICEQGVLDPQFESSFLRESARIQQSYDADFDSVPLQLVHGDCHRGNFIYRPDEGYFLIDFDDCVVAPVVHDLWMLLPGMPENCEKEIQWFLSGYETFCPFPKASLSLCPVLRAMRLIHFVAWCAVQSKEPQFQHHFPEWGSPRYWNETIKELQNI